MWTYRGWYKKQFTWENTRAECVCFFFWSLLAPEAVRIISKRVKMSKAPLTRRQA